MRGMLELWVHWYIHHKLFSLYSIERSFRSFLPSSFLLPGLLLHLARTPNL